ncbi:unnamed protein product [Mytilus coruscus]|uniref:Uncharacterized protein n=1 Tax=Mytilus coruscus TaxID=42192 RepID=A0A6J8CR50_MYTCO|nr:unnamed protein product [Mytilus coruscus]
MSRSDGEEIFLTQNTFSQETNDDNLDLCNLFLEYDTTTTSETYSVACSDISEDEGFSNPKLTQSDDELLINVSKIESKSHQPSTSRFHEPKTDKEIEDTCMQSKKFADSTMSKIKWATTLFKQWKSTRYIRANDPNVGLSPIRVDLAEMSLDELNYSISRFICEVRKTDGTEYPPDTLYSLVICLQLYMDTLGYNHKFLSDSSFIQIKNSLDNVMKLRAEVRVPKKQAEEISLEEEEKIWASGSLGSDNARHLLNTCVVNLFELYASHCPPFPRKDDALYLRLLKIPNGNIWYADQPIGRHSLANIVASICQEAGIGGYRTDHSLRASAATRMYDAGVDKELICEVTGHRSNAVRNYKRTNEKQKRKINSVIRGRPDSENDDSGKFKISKSDGNLSITLNISMKNCNVDENLTVLNLRICKISTLLYLGVVARLQVQTIDLMNKVDNVQNSGPRGKETPVCNNVNTLTNSIITTQVSSPMIPAEYEKKPIKMPVAKGNIDSAREPYDPDIYPSVSVVTRQQVKQRDNPYPKLKVPGSIKDVSLEDIEGKQQSDESLLKLRQYVAEYRNFEKTNGTKVNYIVKKKLIYREFMSSKVENGKLFRQLIVLEAYRNDVIKLAQESLMAGHMATRRTVYRVLSEFYWPGVESDV